MDLFKDIVLPGLLDGKSRDQAVCRNPVEENGGSMILSAYSHRRGFGGGRWECSAMVVSSNPVMAMSFITTIWFLKHFGSQENDDAWGTICP